MKRPDFLTTMLASTAILQLRTTRAQEATREIVLERAAAGMPHKGKVLLAVQAHSDDIPLMAAGTVAKLVKEGYSGYLVRATNDDMGDAPGLWVHRAPSARTCSAMSAITTKSRASWASIGSST
jgi:hypothetical protein